VNLGLDLGTTTGFAYRDGEGGLNFGSYTWRKQASVKKREPEAQIYLGFHDWLKDHLFERIVFEEVKRHMSNRAAMVYGGLRGVMLAVAHSRGADVIPVGVGTLKMWATGKGNAKKPAMIEAARKKLVANPGSWACVGELGNPIPTHDQADALLLLLYEEELSSK